ncbi:MAG: hypothetical protein DRI57_19140 [Deltaproteobacteria bacterium]|nr:MAG: hypothetical protein DRI57_19140 [Deltaproteobacteria bacterium]
MFRTFYDFVWILCVFWPFFLNERKFYEFFRKENFFHTYKTMEIKDQQKGMLRLRHSQANDDVLKLVDFVKNNRKDVFVNTLNTRPVRNYIKRVYKASAYSNKRFEYLTEIMNEVRREQEKPGFDQAKRENTLEAYNHYLKEYPNGKYASQIKRLREYPVFKRAERENTLEACNSYLREYPNGEYVAQVKKMAERPAYEQIRKEDAIEGYANYLREYPNGKYEVQVSRRLDELRQFTLDELKREYDKGIEPLIILAKLKYASLNHPEFLNSEQLKKLEFVKFVKTTAPLKNKKSAMQRTMGGGLIGILAFFNPELREAMSSDTSYNDRTSAILGTVFKDEMVLLFKDSLFTIDHPKPLIEAIFKSEKIYMPSVTVIISHADPSSVELSDQGNYKRLLKVPASHRRSGQSLPVHSYIASGMEVGGAMTVKAAKYALSGSDISETGTLIIRAETGGFISTSLNKFTVELKDIEYDSTRKESISTGFLNGHTADFIITHPGEYRITVRGYSETRKEVYSMTDTYRHSGSGITFCTVKMRDKIAEYRHEPNNYSAGHMT